MSREAWEFEFRLGVALKIGPSYDTPKSAVSSDVIATVSAENFLLVARHLVRQRAWKNKKRNLRVLHHGMR